MKSVAAKADAKEETGKSADKSGASLGNNGHPRLLSALQLKHAVCKCKRSFLVQVTTSDEQYQLAVMQGSIEPFARVAVACQ